MHHKRKEEEKLIVRLIRAWTPEDMQEGTCGICGHLVAQVPVIATAITDERYDVGQVCAECVAYIGSRNPERCPTREQYEEALQRYPAPMFESEEALLVAAGDRDASDIAYEQSWVWRPAGR
jgi:hypothetical protein